MSSKFIRVQVTRYTENTAYIEGWRYFDGKEICVVIAELDIPKWSIRRIDSSYDKSILDDPKVDAALDDFIDILDDEDDED